MINNFFLSLVDISHLSPQEHTVIWGHSQKVLTDNNKIVQTHSHENELLEGGSWIIHLFLSATLLIVRDLVRRIVGGGRVTRGLRIKIYVASS